MRIQYLGARSSLKGNPAVEWKEQVENWEEEEEVGKEERVERTNPLGWHGLLYTIQLVFCFHPSSAPPSPLSSRSWLRSRPQKGSQTRLHPHTPPFHGLLLRLLLSSLRNGSKMKMRLRPEGVEDSWVARRTRAMFHYRLNWIRKMGEFEDRESVRPLEQGYELLTRG